MSLADFVKILRSSGYPVAYRCFEKTEKTPLPQPPYIVYFYINSSDLNADNINYLDIGNYQVELYTKIKEPKTEKRLEDIFNNEKIPYSKVENYIKEEKVFQLVYEVQIIGG